MKKQAAMEKSKELFKNNMEKKAEQATGLNLGFGNATRILQSVMVNMICHTLIFLQGTDKI